MRQSISINYLQKQKWLGRKKGQIQSRYERLSLICFSGGIFGFLLGLSLLFVSDIADKASATLKYRGLFLIFTAVLMLGWGAHFMDRADDEKRQIRKLRIEHLDRKGNL